jgi:hypothetical protein
MNDASKYVRNIIVMADKDLALFKRVPYAMSN